MTQNEIERRAIAILWRVGAYAHPMPQGEVQMNLIRGAIRWAETEQRRAA